MFQWLDIKKLDNVQDSLRFKMGWVLFEVERAGIEFVVAVQWAGHWVMGPSQTPLSPNWKPKRFMVVGKLPA